MIVDLGEIAAAAPARIYAALTNLPKARMPFDADRFIYSLAGRLMAGEWTLAGLRAAARDGLEPHHVRVPKLAERMAAAFAARPSFKQLAAFLRNDPGLFRGISRRSGTFIAAILSRSRRSVRRATEVDERPAGLADIDIPRLSSGGDVARWFEIEPARLMWLADTCGRNRKHPAGALRTYRHRWIPKRGRFPRLLEIPRLALKQMQRKILAEILDRIPVHPAAHGFCAGRSIVTNAALHCGKPTVLRFDLADFFPSVTSARVFGIFRTIGYPPDVARIFMGLCTTQLPADVWEARPDARDGADFIIRQRLITRHLPQGAPTSPVLANLTAHRLDRRLSGLAREAGATYTRYADDLTFSGGPNLARCRKRLGDYIALIAHEEGFALNFRKTRILRAGGRQRITGVVVNVHPNIPRDEFDHLKAILTNCARHGPDSQNRDGHADFRAHLSGKIAHVANINPARGEKLQRIFARIAWDSG
ncbi:MAG TPA: reverse transcriptase family protein [Tepidisphaeraceae bacterium]|jgi:hypothetical protein|nr:reverse transcriptase family protein [Tepidisphaeraceae bacterium]